jgi:hypothetical protein
MDESFAESHLSVIDIVRAWLDDASSKSSCKEVSATI